MQLQRTEKFMLPELLAPAGDMECLKTAILFGADAVYCGGPLLQLRAGSTTFDFEKLKQAVDYTHAHGKKIYVTVNSFAENAEIDVVGDYACELHRLGADAVIVSDLGVISEIHDKCPELPIHVSTQANTQNYKAINVYKQLGVSRVVLGREMTLTEIEGLKGKTDGTEIEVFVHGAMCMAYSGRCLLSSFLINRSGNRGECAQPCRWNYYLVEEKRQNMFIPVVENEKATAILSSTDLKSIEFLDRLIDAGVASFKIEGRMKSPYYVATVVNAYRQYMDGKASLEEAEYELDCISHRPYASGFFFGDAKNSPNNDGLYHSTHSFMGIVLEDVGNEKYVVEQRNRFSVGDTLDILSPGSIAKKFEVTSITGEDGTSRESAYLVQEKVTIDCPHKLFPGDILRKKNI